MAETKYSVLITGASSGIGEASARRLAEQGHKIFLASRNLKKLEDIASEIRNKGGEAQALKLDLENETSIKNCAAQVKRKTKPPFVLINNAGIGIYGRAEDVDVDTARRLFEINFFGAMQLTRELIELLKGPEPGRIINVASGVAKRGFPIMNYYAASKAAQESMSESMRVELEPHGIIVQVVYPLRTETGFSDNAIRYVSDNFTFPGHGPTQTSEDVARAIARALQTNKLRIHPHFSTKILGILNEIAPGLVAKFLNLKETVRRASPPKS